MPGEITHRDVLQHGCGVGRELECWRPIVDVDNRDIDGDVSVTGLSSVVMSTDI